MRTAATVPPRSTWINDLAAHEHSQHDGQVEQHCRSDCLFQTGAKGRLVVLGCREERKGHARDHRRENAGRQLLGIVCAGVIAQILGRVELADQQGVQAAVQTFPAAPDISRKPPNFSMDRIAANEKQGRGRQELNTHNRSDATPVLTTPCTARLQGP